MTQNLFNSVIYSKRKTLALEIMPDATLLVRAPEGMSFDNIQKVMSNKIAWIFKKQQIARQTFKPRIAKEYVNGEGFLYLGEMYKLFLTQSADVPVVFDGKEFIFWEKHIANANDYFISWYKQQAKSVITERAGRFAQEAGATFKNIKINDAKKRWGSCSSSGNLNFSWRLIMAPIKVVDYVVVHELSHISEKNHSKQFWAKVKTLMPDYQEQRKWLRENGHRLEM